MTLGFQTILVIDWIKTVKVNDSDTVKNEKSLNNQLTRLLRQVRKELELKVLQSPKVVNCRQLRGMTVY